MHHVNKTGFCSHIDFRDPSWKKKLSLESLTVEDYRIYQNFYQINEIYLTQTF